MTGTSPHLMALAGCLLLAAAGSWLANAGTAQTAPTVVYIDMALTMRLTDMMAVDPCMCHLSPAPMTL